MEYNSKYCILIPVYKTYKDLNILEKLNLNNFFNKISKSKKHIYFVCPESLDISDYNQFNCFIIRFNDKYFESTKTYSRLLVSLFFYKTFLSYTYMYIFQLDCWLFEDKFEEWTKDADENKYDYIGAPIFSNWYVWTNINKENLFKPLVGNGGFSLRKIQTFIDILDPSRKLYNDIGLSENILDDIEFEDKFFCNDLLDKVYIHKPSWMKALLFSWDMNLNTIWNSMNIHKFPMVAHAVGRNMPFWKDKIQEYNNDEIWKFCLIKYKDFYNKYYGK